MENFKDEELKEMLEDISSLAAEVHIVKNGIEYVNEVKFWEWFTENVVKEGKLSDGSKLPLIDSTAIAEWINDSMGTGKNKYLLDMFVNRGGEYNYVQAMQNNPFELLKGNTYRLATAIEDGTQGIDAVRHNLIFGDTTIQIKAGLSDSFKRVDLSQYIPEPSEQVQERLSGVLHKNSTPVDEVVVNGKILDWRMSDAGRVQIEARGDAHPNVTSHPIDDNALTESGKQRFKDAQSGRADPSITLSGSLEQIGQGIVIGAVVSIGVSTLSNYKDYKNGIITPNEYINYIMRDTAQGMTQGGLVAAINIPVQVLAHSINVGAPVTIPVMIAVSGLVNKVVGPMFGKGEYKKTMQNISYTTNVGKSFVQFLEISRRSFYSQKNMLLTARDHAARANMLDEFSLRTEQTLKKTLEEIG